MQSILSSRFFGTILALLTLGPVCVTALHAVGDHRPDGRFDDLVASRQGGAVAVVPQALESLPPTDALRTAWEEFGADILRCAVWYCRDHDSARRSDL